MSIKTKIKNIAYLLTTKRWQFVYTASHKKELKNFCKAANITLKKEPGEDSFVSKWSKIYNNVNVDFYRFYSNYVGNDSNIVPDDIFHIIIEPCLNSQTSLSTYSDKNLFEKLVDRDILPVCVIRNMDCDYMDRDYNIINMNDETFSKLVINNERLIEQGRCIIKPTTDTGGGAGVRLFCYKDGKWISNDGKELTLGYLNRTYKQNFIIQECIEPSDFVKQFNPTSFSTFRIFTYRSVIDDTVHYIGGYMRVGAKGSFKDNIWGGGYACFINPDGTLCDFASDSSRKRYDQINDIVMKGTQYKIPNFEKIMDLVTYVAKENVPNRLLSFDIMLDKNNEPKMIEFNIKHQTVTTVQTLKKAFFGEFTDEVINYCQTHKQKICYQSITRLA